MLPGRSRTELYECRQRRVDDGITDQPFQPGRHGFLAQRRFIQSDLNAEAGVGAYDTDDRRSLFAFRQQVLRLEFTERGIEASIRSNRFEDFWQLIEGT